VESTLLNSPLQSERGRDPRATPYRPLLWLATAVGVGAAFDYMTLGESNANLVGVWWCLAVVGLVTARLARKHDREVIATVVMLAAAAALGGAWISVCSPPRRRNRRASRSCSPNAFR
jgi:hypothetical protein